MRILVTGASGRLAAALLPALCDDPDVEQVTGIDVRPARFAHPRFRALRADIRDPLARTHLAGQDAAVHLAFIVLRGRRPEAVMREVNVDASAAFMRDAARAGIHRQILLSSAAIYGTGVELAEDCEPRPDVGFAYAQHKLALERIVARELPECVRLRPHVILGRHAQPLLRWLLRRPVYPCLPDPEPAIQCVHELDVVTAVRLALRASCAGPLNLAGTDSFSYGEAIRSLHPRARAVPLSVARALITATSRTIGFGGEPAWVDALARPLTLDCRRARDELGWIARSSARDALTEAAR